MFNFRRNREINRARYFPLAIICLVMLGSITLSNVWAQAPRKAQIAFSSDRDRNLEIYVMDTDGKNQRNLTNHPGI